MDREGEIENIAHGKMLLAELYCDAEEARSRLHWFEFTKKAYYKGVLSTLAFFANVLVKEEARLRIDFLRGRDDTNG